MEKAAAQPYFCHDPGTSLYIIKGITKGGLPSNHPSPGEPYFPNRNVERRRKTTQFRQYRKKTDARVPVEDPERRRITVCLRRAGCVTVGDVLRLIEKDEDGLRRIRNLGSRSEAEIRESLQQYEEQCRKAGTLSGSCSRKYGRTKKQGLQNGNKSA